MNADGLVSMVWSDLNHMQWDFFIGSIHGQIGLEILIYSGMILGNPKTNEMTSHDPSPTSKLSDEQGNQTPPLGPTPVPWVSGRGLH